MKVLLLNQFGGGSEAPTGCLAQELADFLNLHGHTAQVISSDPSYRIKRSGWRRWVHELKSHLVLLARALACTETEAVISFTSPVCLPVTARLAATLLKAKLYVWSMDVYPELALALRELKPGPLATALRSLMGGAYRSAADVVALDEDMREFFKKNYRIESSVIPPWPPDLAWPDSTRVTEFKTWLYSGNLGQAHEIKTLLEIQKRLETVTTGIHLVLQGAGAQWTASQEMAWQLGLKNVLWRNPVPESELTASLLHADVLVVTRKPETKGLLWPSKLALAQLSGRPLLWIGDTDSRTAAALREEPRNGTFRPDQHEEIFLWLKRTLAEPSSRSGISAPTQISRLENLQKWLSLLDYKKK